MKYILALALVFLLIGCVSTIEDVKKADNVGEKVTVRGEVKSTIKLGSLSGYTLEDDTGSIGVASESLPKEGALKTTSGTLVKNPLLGYYIEES